MSIFGGHNPLKTPGNSIRSGAITTFRAGQRFTDTLGRFWPVVIDKFGGMTINASTNNLASIAFHDTLNVSTYDVALAGGGPGLLTVRPSTGSALVGLSIISGGTSISLATNGSGRPTVGASNATGAFFYDQTIIIRTKAGAPVDGDFSLPQDGMLVMDTTNTKLYCRTGGAWKSVTLT